LIADEDAPTRAEMREAVEQDERFTVVAEATDGPRQCRPRCASGRTSAWSIAAWLGSGIAATREITARLPETKVVMITASLDEDDLFSALRAGAIGYLHEDIDPARLPHVLNDAVEGGAPISRRLV